jgi:hypothetical protein
VKGILAVAVCIVALMVVLKDGRLLQTTGLTGTCSHYSQTADAEFEVCKPGKLEGLPDLTKRGCKIAGTKGKVEFWRCPAGVEASDAGR